jgi:hypothetical protein
MASESQHWQTNEKRCSLCIVLDNGGRYMCIYFEYTVAVPIPGGLGSDCSSSKCSPGGADSGDPLKDEPGDFIETNCHWRECGLEFPTQDDLVKVTNLSFYITDVT